MIKSRQSTSYKYTVYGSNTTNMVHIEMYISYNFKVIEDLFYDIIKKQFDIILHMYRYNQLFFNFFSIYYSLYFFKNV